MPEVRTVLIVGELVAFANKRFLRVNGVRRQPH